MSPGEQIEQQLTTIRDYLRWAISRMQAGQVYYGHGTDNPLDEALALVFSLLGIPRDAENLCLDARLTLEERRLLIDAIQRRVEERVPVPYITGEAWFAGMEFHVNSNVLIPRSPFAELIEQGFQPWVQQTPGRILDLCTGSGCIGIACAMVFGEASVDLADISSPALEVARANIARYELQGRVDAIQSDLFEALQGRQYDLIVSNPPYVDSEDFGDMPAEYHHEPAMALEAGEDGLDLVRVILRQAEQLLTADGVLIVELGNSGHALEQAYPTVPFTWLEFERGGHGVFLLTRDELAAHRESLA